MIKTPGNRNHLNILKSISMRNKLDELYPVCIDHYSKDIEQRRLFKEFNYGNPYVHKCIYCGDYFMCKHQSQKYCHEKFGKEDHCRREQEKRLKSERDSVTNQKRHNIEINQAIISKNNEWARYESSFT